MMPMMDKTLKKMLQKRVYDLLSHKYGILMLVAGGFLLTVSAFHFGEAWLEWSQEKYEAVFNSFSDNIAGKSFRDRLSVPLPIDVVYTWVNGSDPDLIRDLELVKVSKEKMRNLSSVQETKKREERCSYTNCLCMGVLLYPPLSSSTSLAEVLAASEILKNVTDLRDIKETKDGPTNFTLLALEQESDVKQVVHASENGWTFQDVNHTVTPAFYTSDVNLPHGLLVPEVVMMSGFPSQYSGEDILQAITKRLNVTDKAVATVKLHSDKGVALLNLSQTAHYDMLIKDKNFTIEGKEIRLSAVKLIWDLKFAMTDDVVAANRFEDNEELRYSLRSIEQFASWVRHIFIVTNGQIPYWLNLDNPRLSIITHDEIFLNCSHLPTFSSPAIEANIHRIPGLSDKFLYLNDDVMFGSPVWPDDFYTHSTGQKMYLTWPVPNCNEGCPSTWIKDGYCDKACNSSECEWDGGDCLGTGGHVQLGAGFHGDQGNYLADYVSYCATGCANNWLADKYCDQACNKKECGFDTGDCGVSNYDKLVSLGQVYPDMAQPVQLSPGELIGYFNLTDLLGSEGKVTNARYRSQGIIRTIAVSNKFRVMTVVLKKGHNATKLELELEYTRGDNHTHQLNMSMAVDTSVNKTLSEVDKSGNKSSAVQVSQEDALDAEAFQEGSLMGKGPQMPTRTQDQDSEERPAVHPDSAADILEVYANVSMTDSLREDLATVGNLYKEGELTEMGIQVRMAKVMMKHKSEMELLLSEFKRLKLEKEERKKREQMNNAASKFISDISGARASNQSAYQAKQDSQAQVKSAGEKRSGSLQASKFLTTMNRKKNQFRRENSPGGEKQGQGHLSGTEKGGQKIPGNQGPGEFVKAAANRDESNSGGKKNVENKAGTDKSNPGAQKTAVIKTTRGESIPGIQNIVETGAHKAKGNPSSHVEAAEKRANDEEPRHGRKLLAMLFLSEHLARLEAERERTAAKRRKDSLGEEMTDEEFIEFVKMNGADDDVGGFPWERKAKQTPEEKRQDLAERERKANEYVVEGWQGRQLLDTFGDSLRHVNRIYNKAFGFTARKVPGHMPHMIDKNIMQDLQDRFPEEWDATSAHKIRSSTDMQYAFAYYYYVMGVTVPVTVEEVFDQMDTDRSGILSDREIRTLATKLYDLPLYLETLTGMEAMLTNCSQHMEDPVLDRVPEEDRESYFDKAMPQVTKYLFTNCDTLTNLVHEKFKPVPKYKTTVVDESDIAFKMIHTNVSHVVGQLDDIRKHSKKFICLNDNIDHTKEEAKTVKAILQDFYESLLPIPSQFELPRDYRNRFLHMDELREWRVYRDRLRFWTHVALGALVALTVVSFLGEKIESLRRKWSNRQRRRRQGSSSSESSSPDSVTVTPTTKTAQGTDSSWWGDAGVETV